MRIDLDNFVGPTARRSFGDLVNEKRNGVAYIVCWKFTGDFPGFHFLQYCGEITHINIDLHPERPTVLDFSSVPSPSSIVHVNIDGGNIRRNGGWKYSEKSGVVCGLNHLSNLSNLEVKNFPALVFEESTLPSSLEKFAIFNPGKVDLASIPGTKAAHIHLLGFDRRHVSDFSFISRFSGLERLWMDYCNGMECFPTFHPDARPKGVVIVKARRLRDIEALAKSDEIEEIELRFCPLLTLHELCCLQRLPKLREFWVSDKRQATELRNLFPNVKIVVERITSG